MSSNNRHIKASVIKIPSVDKDTRIGNILNHIFSIIYQMELTDVQEDMKIFWDFSNCAFLHPFFVGAIALLKRQYGECVELRGLSDGTARYLEAIMLDAPLEIPSDENDESIWEEYKGKTYLPICVFKPFDSSSIKVQELVQKAINEQLGLGISFKRIISLLLSELIDNITEHSKSSDGFLFCQHMPRNKALYVMICDTGRSIYSSYASDARYCDELTQQESSGLVLALSGKSTKNLPEGENRGYGISKSRKLVVEGMGGEFFLLSGSTFARHDLTGETVYDLPQDIRWNGTAVLMMIPTIVPNGLDIYDYIS